MKACTQCGRCCTYAPFMETMQADADDIRRWRREKRNDILMYAYIYDWKPNSVGRKMSFAFADLWISPRTNEALGRCPFVRKVRNEDRYKCTIYETRPKACREYPIHVQHMAVVDCEMLEDGDTDDDVRRFMTGA